MTAHTAHTSPQVYARIGGILYLMIIIAGLGYLLTTLKPFLFPSINVGFAEYTYYGELIFMLWLLIKGSRTKESAEEARK